MASETKVTAAVQIASIIRQLIQNRELMNAVFNDGKDGMSTLLLEANADSGIIIFDAPSDPATIRKLATTAKVIFTGALRGAKIRFACTNVKETKYRGTPALSARLPDALTTVQNRNSFRVKTAGHYCTLYMAGQGMVRAPIRDISVDGAFLQVGSVSASLNVGQILSGCVIDLGPFGKITCNLEIRWAKRSMGSAAGIGCRFVRLPMTTQSLLARFIAHEERRKASW